MTIVKYYFICAFILCTLSCFGQRVDTLTLYYPINKFQLKIEDQHQLSDTVNTPNIKAILILGYTDYLGSVGYNLLLSAKRAETAKAFLLKKNNKLTISAQGKGQVDESVKVKKGDPETRKVVIIIERELTVASPKIDSVKIDKTLANTVIPSNNIINDNHKFELKIDSLFKGQAGTSLTLDELNFEGGRHILTQRSNIYLPILLKYLLKYNKVKIMIIGHICCIVGVKDGYDYDSKNYELSKNRAKAIYDYLVDNGVSSHRMNYKE
jgi:outer membrane protein OmpA-like peptidoglycan-associated protein